MLAVVAIGLLVLSAARFLIIFDVTLGSNNGFPLVARLLASFVPHYLSFMLPLAVYWGSYSVIRRMAMNAELATLQATGISLRRIFAPLIVLGICITLVNFMVVGWLEPVGRYTYRGVIHKLEKESFYLKARDGTFMKLGDKTVLVSKIKDDRRSFDSVFIYEPLPPDGATTTTATRGELIFGQRKLVLRLFGGHQLKIFDLADADSARHMEFQQVDIPLDDVISVFRPRGDDEQEMLLPELLLLRQLPAGTSTAAVSAEFNRKLVIILSSLFMPILAASCAVLNPRRKNLYQAGVVLLLIAIYHQIVELGATLIEKSGVSPLTILWPVFLGFFAMSLFLFHAVSNRTGGLEGFGSAMADGFAFRLRALARLRVAQ